MTTLSPEQVQDRGEATRIPTIDVDVHPTVAHSDSAFERRLSPRWRQYIETFGLGNIATEMGIPPQRSMTHRLDAVDANGRAGADPEFVRMQLLDEFDMSGVVLSDAMGIVYSRGGNNFPEQLGVELNRAYNDAHREIWLEADPRYYVSINLPTEMPQLAVEEIQRCREGELGERFVAVLIEPRTEYPIGNPKYWPIFEACDHYGIPVTFHTSPGRRMTGCGPINFYYEWHVGFPLRNYTLASSLIFEGVFDRFPGLKVALIEQSWAWAVPFAWRLDASWRMLRDEVPDLAHKPSEYLRDHFWFASQPMVEPEHLEDTLKVLDQFHGFFGPEHLMFASDYPHWDFDSPYEALPAALPAETRRRILGENASELFSIPLLAGTGIRSSEIEA